MPQEKRKYTLLLAVLGTLALLVGCATPPEPEVIDPHAGQVQVNDGATTVWLTPREGVAASSVSAADFITDENGRPCYVGTEFTTLRGIDVSDYQGSIDWQRVKQSGIDFAILRCVWRGYGEKGSLHSDESFEAYYQGACAAGLQLGAYVFSQATTPAEAAEEASFALDVLAGKALTLPVFWDWERIHNGDTARTDTVDISTLTAMAGAFCDTLKKGGEKAGVYFNRQLGYYAYEWEKLPDCTRWVADYNAYPDFYYASELWQYSTEGQINGIDIQVDENLLLLPKD